MNMHLPRPDPLNPRDLRDVLGLFATGVAVVTTCNDDAGPIGMTVNSFASVSLEPAEILWSIASLAPSRDAFATHQAFAVNVMPEECKEEALQFARPSDNKFDGVAWRRGWRDVPVLECALATLECDVKDMFPCGDHEIVVGSVRLIDRKDGNPLVFFRGQFTSLGAPL